jgi:hypothetical protein
MATGPAQEYPVTLVAPVTDRFKVVPAHTGPLLLALVSAGNELTVAAVVYWAVQPVPVPLLTVTVYVPFAAVVADGTLAFAEEDEVIATGPAHA